MANISFEIPDELIGLFGEPNAASRELRLAAALHWCSRGELSTSLAARLAGLSYAEFLDAAARNRIMLFPPDMKELQNELAHPLSEAADIS